MNQLPVDLLFEIVDYLNPKERQRFAETNLCHRYLFPLPLILKITSKSSGSALQERFFVSSRNDPQTMLLDHEELIFEQDYLFWAFDYERGNRVYLSRHGQKLLNTEYTQYMFTMGLRPKHPTQFVRIKGGEAGTKVGLEDSIGLDIGGTSNIKHTPDSKDRMYLSSQALTMGALWYAIQQKWGNYEKLQLYKCQNYHAQKHCTATTITNNHKHHQHHQHHGQPQDDRATPLIIHAIPDICDGLCSLYSPKSLKDGRAACELHHINIKFHFWVLGGLLCFKANMSSVPFAFGVPMLEEDKAGGIKDPTVDCLKVLLKKNSSRWWAVKHYMSVAASIQSGNVIKIEDFMRTVKDHEDHTIIRDDSKNLVYIQVQDAVVENGIADHPKNENEVWEFMFCGS
ncbi:unnamed protein product [Cylindrotheca closterium]|uniref:F-box domain-containing protein n=1 Tax=Cylindrotheca closterium TaxID=2856 RepID=A0AAD2G188_9STRA|nr:unnamed protein product [Cylindrotheca closterium]